MTQCKKTVVVSIQEVSNNFLTNYTNIALEYFHMWSFETKVHVLAYALVYDVRHFKEYMYDLFISYLLNLLISRSILSSKSMK